MRVLLIEDHESIRFAVGSLVRLMEDGEVVGEAATGAEGVALARERRPDVVVMDLRLGDETTGVEACREIKDLPDAPRVLIYTSYTGSVEVYLCRLAGADGYLNKRAGLDELTRAIRTVAEGGSLWPEQETGDPASFFGDVSLTERERDVLELAVRGYDNARIARELYVGLPTVKTHMRGVLRKLGLEKRRDIPVSRLWDED